MLLKNYGEMSKVSSFKLLILDQNNWNWLMRARISFFLVILLLGHLIFSVHLQSSIVSRIHVIGDSHCRAFEGIENCVIHHIGPRTMHRIGRDRLSILDFRSLGIQENDFVILSFGEIDVRCFIGQQRDKENRDLNEIIDTLLNNYFSTIILNKLLYKNVSIVLYTIPPPSNQMFNPNYPFWGTVQDRVMISKLLNKKLLEKSSELNIDVLDVYDDYANHDGILIPHLSDGNVHIIFNQPIRKKLHSIINQY